MLETMGASAMQIKITKEIELAEATTVTEMVALTGRSERYINDLPINAMFIKPKHADKQGITYDYTPYDSVNIDEVIDSLTEIIESRLTHREQLIIKMAYGFYGHSYSLPDIQKSLGLSSYTVVSNQFRAAKNRLRELCRVYDLENPFPEVG